MSFTAVPAKTDMGMNGKVAMERTAPRFNAAANLPVKPRSPAETGWEKL